jgi:predicted RNA-binding Zn ribbon-like protein
MAAGVSRLGGSAPEAAASGANADNGADGAEPKPRAALRRMGRAVEEAESASAKAQPSAGALCLDFLATLDASDGDGWDALTSPGALGGWLESFGLPVPAGGLTVEDLDAARTLRDAVERLARSLVADRDVLPSDVRAVNVFAQRHTPVFLLRPSGRQRTVVEEIDVAGSLSVIARDAIHVFADSDLSRLRQCARSGCETLFYDRSPSGRRRWCAMKGCGEIVASAAYRKRLAAKDAR